MRERVLTAWDNLRDAYLDASGLRSFLETDKRKPTKSQIAKAKAAADALTSTELAHAVTSVTIEAYLAASHDAMLELEARANESAYDRADVIASFEVKQTRALRALESYSLKFAEDVVDRERDAIKRTIADGIEQGIPTEEIAQSLRDLLHDVHITGDDGSITRFIPLDSWAELVARTETSRAYNGGALDLYQSAGVEKVQILTADDERVCEICEPKDGEVVSIDDEDAGASFHASCRCVAVIADDK